MSESERERMERIQRELKSGSFDMDAISKELGQAKRVSKDDTYTRRNAEFSRGLEEEITKTLNDLRTGAYDSTYWDIQRTPANGRLEGQRVGPPEPAPAPAPKSAASFSRTNTGSAHRTTGNQPTASSPYDGQRKCTDHEMHHYHRSPSRHRVWPHSVFQRSPPVPRCAPDERARRQRLRRVRA